MNAFSPRSLKTRVTLFTLAIFLAGLWSLALYASEMLRADLQRELKAKAIEACCVSRQGTLKPEATCSTPGTAPTRRSTSW